MSTASENPKIKRTHGEPCTLDIPRVSAQAIHICQQTRDVCGLGRGASGNKRGTWLGLLPEGEGTSKRLQTLLKRSETVRGSARQ
jgi:hypothetical protein